MRSAAVRHSMSSFMRYDPTNTIMDSQPSPQAAYRSMPNRSRPTRGVSPPTKSFKSASSNKDKKKSKKRIASRRAAPPSRPQSFGGGFGGGSAFDQAISYHSANVNTSNSRGATVDFEKESSRDVFARNDFVKSYSSSSAKQVKAESKPSNNADWFEGVTFVPAGMSSQESAMVDSSNLLSELSQVDSFNDDALLMAELDDMEELEGGLEEEEVLADFGAFQPVSAPKKVKLDFNWLLSQQKANGMFKFAPTDPRFTEYSRKSIDSQVGGKLKDKTMLKAVLATLFALAALESQFATRKTEWQFMFAKGKSFISKQLNDKSDFDGLLNLLRSDDDVLNALLA